ncbi:RNA-directed DNA polymerase, eukaryota [Tanacetum coccineum]|uniref:RNA-directed DNA polymerase, eukaryota n=1 Tax=Tanacetum coccineum TaxID=301880 RepID=A0ABQ5DIA3_9ASTR
MCLSGFVLSWAWIIDFFWYDNWSGSGATKDTFPRLFALENHKEISVRSKLDDSSLDSSFRRTARGGIEQVQFDALVNLVILITVTPKIDRWVWSLEGSGEFSVASIRKVIDANRLKSEHSMTRWVKFVPIKINVLAWKIKMDALPSRFNISRRGIDISSLTCPICDAGIETTDHLFFSCLMAKQITHKIATWWEFDQVDTNNYTDWSSWLASLRLPFNHKVMLEGSFTADDMVFIEEDQNKFEVLIINCSFFDDFEEVIIFIKVSDLMIRKIESRSASAKTWLLRVTILITMTKYGKAGKKKPLTLIDVECLILSSGNKRSSTGAQAQEYTLLHDPLKIHGSGTNFWRRGALLQITVFDSFPRKDPQMGILPHDCASNEQKYRADYGFVATMDREIRRDPEREVGYRITDSWDEIVETLQGAPVSTDTELGRHMTAFETRVRQDTDEVYTRLDDEQSQRQLLAEARLSREAWRRSMDASDLPHGEVMSLRTTVLGQMSEIRELHAADRQR